MSKLKIENISTLITYHVQTQFLPYSKILEIYDLIPEDCKYYGIGFRAIVNTKLEDIQADQFKNLYWSSSLNGINKYLDISKYKKGHIFKANIKGVDLNKTLHWLNSLTPDKYPRTNMHEDEEEILVIKYSEFELYNTF